MQFLGLLATLTFAFGASGCAAKGKYLDEIKVELSDNLEVVALSAVFTPKIKLDLLGNFAVGEYGMIFVNPFTETSPFELGFQLNTEIFQDKFFLELEPTTVLPNGEPIGAPYALVEVSGQEPVSSSFDLYGYIDVHHGNWLGLAMIYDEIDTTYLPEDFTLSLVFDYDEHENPTVKANVFGPILYSDGSLKRAGGVALVVNAGYYLGEAEMSQVQTYSTTVFKRRSRRWF